MKDGLVKTLLCLFDMPLMGFQAFPEAGQVTHAFLLRAGNPHGDQLAGPMEVASVWASRRSLLTRSPAFLGIRDGVYSYVDF
jgi:hypothetical protein